MHRRKQGEGRTRVPPAGLPVTWGQHGVGGSAGVDVPWGILPHPWRPQALVRAGTRATQARGPDTSAKDTVTLPTSVLRDHRRRHQGVRGKWGSDETLVCSGPGVQTTARARSGSWDVLLSLTADLVVTLRMSSHPRLLSRVTRRDHIQSTVRLSGCPPVP